MNFSRILAILSLIVTGLTAAGSLVSLLPPKVGVWVAIVSATISAFTKAVHDKGLDAPVSVVPTDTEPKA